jgi:hypothetical protein
MEALMRIRCRQRRHPSQALPAAVGQLSAGTQAPQGGSIRTPACLRLREPPDPTAGKKTSGGENKEA